MEGRSLPPLHSEEAVEDLGLGGLKIIQHHSGYRFSLDPVLLCAFVQVPVAARVVDLGTGGGVIPLLLARSAAAAPILGVELQAALADRAQRSVRLNGLEERVRILQADIRLPHPQLLAQGFDLVLSNPPYRQGGTGRLAPNGERAAARHELAGGLEDFLAAGGRLLGDGGRLALVYLAERLTDLLTQLRSHRLEPKRLRMVHGRSGDVARMVLIEARKRGRPGLAIEPPLFVYEGDGWSAEVRGIHAGKG